MREPCGTRSAAFLVNLSASLARDSASSRKRMAVTLLGGGAVDLELTTGQDTQRHTSLREHLQHLASR